MNAIHLHLCFTVYEKVYQHIRTYAWIKLQSVKCFLNCKSKKEGYVNCIFKYLFPYVLLFSKESNRIFANFHLLQNWMMLLFLSVLDDWWQVLWLIFLIILVKIRITVEKKKPTMSVKDLTKERRPVQNVTVIISLISAPRLHTQCDLVLMLVRIPCHDGLYSLKL